MPLLASVFQRHLPAQRHRRIHVVRVGNEHEVVLRRLLNLRLSGQQILRRPRPSGRHQRRVFAGNKILQLLQPRSHLGRELRVLVRLRWRQKLRRERRFNRTPKDAVQRVIIRRRNRIELVVVAASTRRRHPQQPASDDINPVIQHVMQVVHEPPAERQKSHRRQRSLVVSQIQLIGGKLLDDEPIKRQIGIQRADYVIAIGPTPLKLLLLEEHIPFRVGIPSDIQPMSSPAFAVMRRRQQPLDDPLERIGRLIRFKVRDLVHRRRQPDQIEGRSTQQRPLVGTRRRSQFCLDQLRQHEPINRRLRPHPKIVRTARHRRLDNRLKGPVLLRRFPNRIARRLRRVLRPERPAPDPFRQRLHLVSRQRFLRRHLQTSFTPNRFHERTDIGLPRDSDNAPLAPFHKPRFRIEPQARLLLLRSVTPLTPIDQDRPHARFKELTVLSRIVRRERTRCDDHDADDQTEPKGSHVTLPSNPKREF